MSAINFMKEQFQRVKAIVERGTQKQYDSLVTKYQIPVQYHSSMGRLVLDAELTAKGARLEDGLELSLKDSKQLTLEDIIRFDFDEPCKKEKDLRRQVGHVLENLVEHDRPSKESFIRNVEATVMLLDREFLNLPLHAKPNEVIKIPSEESMRLVDLSKFSEHDAPKDMCDGFFYANELIPNSNIFGSGYFFEHNKVLTAAHVLDAAFYSGIRRENGNLKDLVFIRGHWGFGKENSVFVRADQLYVLDELEIFPEGQVFNGATHGDIAWVKVAPLYPSGDSERVYPGEFNGIATPASLQLKEPLYGLGHGLGVPMKLSFKGVAQGMSDIAPPYFNCDMNILPGASGSPIFDSKTHKLVGIVSGLHLIRANYNPVKDCLMPEIEMKGIKSGVATPVFPLLETIKN